MRQTDEILDRTAPAHLLAELELLIDEYRTMLGGDDLSPAQRLSVLKALQQCLRDALRFRRQALQESEHNRPRKEDDAPAAPPGETAKQATEETATGEGEVDGAVKEAKPAVDADFSALVDRFIDTNNELTEAEQWASLEAIQRSFEKKYPELVGEAEGSSGDATEGQTARAG